MTGIHTLFLFPLFLEQDTSLFSYSLAQPALPGQTRSPEKQLISLFVYSIRSDFY